MHNGYVKVFRKLRASSFYKDSQYVHVWLHLLLSVNHTEKRLKLPKGNKVIDLLPGQVLTSRDSLSEQTGVNVSKVERILKTLESEQQIEQQAFTKYRVISITNWQSYQQSEQQIEQQMNSKRTADEQQMNTNNNVKKPKNVKKEPESIDLPAWFPLETWNAFKEMRRKMNKPLTDYAEKLAIKKLGTLREAGEDPKAVLEQSILNSYQGIFELKKNLQSKQPPKTFTDIRSEKIVEAMRDFVGEG